MSYYRRERPAAEATPREKLEAIVRTSRLPDHASLEALLEGLDEAELGTRGRCTPPDKILEDAFQVLLKAHQTLRRAGDAQRGAVRGCTLDLLVLVIRQALGLQQTLEERARESKERAEDVERLQRQLRDLFSRAITLREQARRVLAGVVKADPSFQGAVLRAATGADDGGSASAAMLALAQLGHRVLAEGSPTVVARAGLLGMDKGYLDGLETLGKELLGAERELGEVTAHGQGGEDALAREAGLTLHLMMHVIECFEAAHEIDPNVPRLRPTNTARLVHRLSKLPPPPPPGPGAGRVQARLADIPPLPQLDPVGSRFQGGLGARRSLPGRPKRGA